MSVYFRLCLSIVRMPASWDETKDAPALPPHTNASILCHLLHREFNTTIEEERSLPKPVVTVTSERDVSGTSERDVTVTPGSGATQADPLEVPRRPKARRRPRPRPRP